MKKYFKKGLSLMMAALMLLSCWVFFAPEAEAVSSGTYYWRVRVDSGNATGGWDQGDWKVYGKPNNGKGSESQLSSFSQYVNFNESGKIIKSGSSTSFPTKVTFTYSFGGGMTWREMKGTAYLDVSGNNSSWTQVGSVDLGAKSSAFSAAKGTKTITGGNYPKASSVVFDQAPGAVTVPKTGTATTSMRTHLNDQYGVRVYSSASTYSKTYSLSSNRNSTTGVSCTAGATTSTYDPWTLSVTNSAKLTGYDTNTISATVSYTFNGATVSAYKTFVVTDPQYTFSFNTNGGDSISPSTAITKYYYNKLTSAEIPSSGVRPGYEFIAMYGDAKLNYDVTKPTPGSTTGFTGQLTNTTPIEGDKTWYAAWWAKPVTVTLVDNMGNVLGETFESKYDQKANYLYKDWPTDVEFKRNTETGTFNYRFNGQWKVIDAKKFLADGTQVEYQGAYGTNSDSFVLKGDTVFQAQFDIEKNSYNVKFYGETGNILLDTDYVYRDQPTQPTTSKATDNYFSYTFKGWHRVLDGEQTTGYIVNKDGYLSTSATSDAADLVDGKKVMVGTVDDFTVRSDAEYVPVFEKTYNEYTVTFKYKSALGVDLTSNNEGKTYHFGDALNLPEVPESYTSGGYRYPLVNWTKNNAATGSTSLPATLDDTVTTHATRNVTYVAVYGSGEPAEYDVTFTYVQADGTETTDAYVINHNDPVIAPAGVPQTYRDDDYEYTFAGWKDQDGEGLVSPAYKDAFYVAQYTSKKLYTVSFMNEGVEFGESAKYVAGQTIALPAEVPTKVADKTAWQYTFDKWADEEGNAVTVMPENDLVLTAQYIPSYIEYTIKFVWKDAAGNDVTDSKTYHYRDLIDIPNLEDLNQTKYKDDTYTYTFKAWDKDVPIRCLGDGEMSEDGKTGTLTYTATYRREYNYYTVKWMKETAIVDGNPQYAEYMNDSFIYNERVRIPVITPDSVFKPYDTLTKEQIKELTEQNIGETEFNQKYSMVLAHWAYKDKNGNFVAVNRDTRITGSITFYPVYKITAKVCTVNLYNEDATQLIQVIRVPYQTNLEEYAGISIPKKAYTDDIHYSFNGWVNKTTGSLVTVIEDDCDLKATFTQEAHTYDEVKADREPTFFETGSGTKICKGCAKAVTGVTIEKVPDTVAPTAKLFVKNAVTVSGGEVPTEAILVAPKNNLVAATVDSAEESKYNENGSGIGTGKIEYYVSLGADALDFGAITDWMLRFDYDTYVQALKDRGLTDEEVALEMSEFQANATAYVGDLADSYPDIIADGNTFIFYAKISDRNGNVNYVRSQPLTYDATTPVITLTGNGNGGSKFCVEATAAITENVELASVTVNGEERTLTDGKLTISGKGLYQIAATDVAGNVTAKNIEILGSHNEKATVTAPTCTEDGGATFTCTVCGTATKEPTVTEKLGHNMVEIDKVEATCLEEGYTLDRCTRCGITEKRDIVPTIGNHTYNDENDGWAVSKKATCVEKGTKYRVCTVCGEYEYEQIPIDANGHVWYRGVVTKPTCTVGGYTDHTCKYCGTTERVAGSETEALGHEASGKWVVILEASCAGLNAEEDNGGGTTGTRVQYCVRDGKGGCSGEVMATETIPVPSHTWEYRGKFNATDEADGYTLYVCRSCGVEKRVPGEPQLVKNSVIFMVDGAEYKKETRFSGESVIVDDPVKATDKTYKYTFQKWIDEDGKKVDLPVVVSAEKDIVLTAVFAETQINYTYVFYTRDDADNYKQYKKVGYLKYDADAKAENFAGPYDYEDNGASYKFVGWVVKGDVTAKPTTEIKISEVSFDANNTAEFEAVFKKTLKKFYITYAYDLTSGNYIYTKELNYGDKVENVNELIPADIMATVKKDADDAYHYTFSKWSVRDGDAALESITKSILVLPVFTATEHDYKNVEGEGHYLAPTCTKDGYQDTACVCGKKFKKIYPATGHAWSTTPDEDGKIECSICHEKKDYDATFSVTFYNDEGATVKKISGIKWKEDISAQVPKTVTKASDDMYDYTFSHWFVKGDETKTPAAIEVIVKSNAEYVAEFTKTTRTYKVIYRVSGETEALQINRVEAGSPLPPFTGKTPVNNTFNDYTHKVSHGWDKDASDFPNGITEDVVITAVFVDEDHDIKSVSRKNATCTEPITEVFKCTKCAYTYNVKTGKPLGHHYVLVESVEPTETKAGYELYKCDRVGCGATYKNEFPPKAYIFFTVTVLDQNGAPVQGATVTILDGSKFVASGSTDGHGKVIFKVEEAKKYRVIVEYDKQHIEGDLTVNPDGTTEGAELGVSVTHCSCTCHRDGVWPAIFRFFHKIIKMMVGDFVCCGNPDPRYG